MDPIVTVRCVNPVYDATKQIYTVDVEFQCNQPNWKLYGMNVRFLYDKGLMLFKSFSGYASGYGTYNSLPRVSGGSINLFGFTGDFGFINGILVLKSQANASFLPVDNWLKLFQLNFTPKVSGTICPPIVWDKKPYDPLTQPEAGGFSGSGGVCITLQGEKEWETICTKEQVEYFNWTFDKLTPPYGHPMQLNCINI